MKIKNIRIKNFKAIADASIELGDFTAIVGANGSGKSSVLQAMHWVFQSSRSPTVRPEGTQTKGRTLSEKDATYMPSPSYSRAANGADYGNNTGTPQLDLHVEVQLNDGTAANAHLWLKSARNEGVLVHVPASNVFTTTLRDSREFSAYIPGLAGIPLVEERRSTAIVHRLAAAGDANTVLRNILLLLKSTQVNGINGLTLLQSYLSQVMGVVTLDVTFEERRDSHINAYFQAGDMTGFKPLELAGIGFLQVTQIFAYLLYFQPRLILIDEPDAHLHPTAQERLVTVLVEAASFTGTQVVVTTHSPSVVRALPADAKVVWMKGGVPQAEGDTEGRRLMGWGLLDRRVLLITEDEDAGMLRTILAQWPHLDRQVAIWPVRGSNKVPDAEVIKDFISASADSLKILVHRDRDFLMPVEVDAYSGPYVREGINCWCTQFSDVEGYWTNEAVIAEHFSIAVEDAQMVLTSAIASCNVDNAALLKRRKKRNDVATKLNRQGVLPQYSDADVEAEAVRLGPQYSILGKDLRDAIRSEAQKQGYRNHTSYSRVIPLGQKGQIATDLRDLLMQILQLEE
jgi:energy-coupling factor transporter ATP-binding protein EcfA2